MSQWHDQDEPARGWATPGGGPEVAAQEPADGPRTGGDWPSTGWTTAPARSQPGIVPLRPLNLGEIWDGAFRAFRQNPRATIGLSAIVVVATTLVTLAATLVVVRDLARVTNQLETGGGDVSSLLGLLQAAAPLLVGSFLLQAVAVQVLNGMLIVSVSRAVLGRTTSLGELWRAARHRLGGLLLLALLVTLAGAVGAVALAPGVLVLALVDGSGGAAAGAVSLLVGALAWAVVSAWLWVKWSMATPALLLEQLSVRAALGRSWRLTRGAFWRTLGILLLTVVVVGLVTAAVATPFSVVGTVLGALVAPRSEWGGVAVSQSVGALGSIVGSVVAYPFLASVTALLYVDLRVRREGLDVELHRAAAAG